MSGDSDSSESPTAKWLDHDRRGDRGRIARAEKREGERKKKNKARRNVWSQPCNCFYHQPEWGSLCLLFASEHLHFISRLRKGQREEISGFCILTHRAPSLWLTFSNDAYKWSNLMKHWYKACNQNETFLDVQSIVFRLIVCRVQYPCCGRAGQHSQQNIVHSVYSTYILLLQTLERIIPHICQKMCLNTALVII